VCCGGSARRGGGPLAGNHRCSVLFIQSAICGFGRTTGRGVRQSAPKRFGRSKVLISSLRSDGSTASIGCNFIPVGCNILSFQRSWRTKGGERMKKAVGFLILIFMLAGLFPFQAEAAESDMKMIFTDGFYGGLAGALVGGAFLAFSKH